MQIREAEKRDLERICILANQINQLHHDNEPDLFIKPDDLLSDREFWESKIFGDESIALVAEFDGVVEGFVLAMLTAVPVVPFLKKTRVCRVGTIVVSEAQQHKGLGKQLLNGIESWAVAQNVTEIRLEVMEFNVGAHSFYDKLGFHTQSRVLSKSIA